MFPQTFPYISGCLSIPLPFLFSAVIIFDKLLVISSQVINHGKNKTAYSPNSYRRSFRGIKFTNDIQKDHPNEICNNCDFKADF